MSKKQYICTHTWNDSESRKLVIKQTKGMTDKMFFEALKSEKAETLQHWMGKDDFFSVIGMQKVKMQFLKTSRKQDLIP